jgi:hypothetical protein
MRCGSGDGGGDGGGGAAGVPIVPLVPPLIPFFPPILPPIVGAPGSGSGTPGVAAVPIPLITNCSNSNTTGGTYISIANFTEHIPCCAANTVSLDVLEVGSIPNYHYICEYTGNGSTYAWVPQAATSAATFNVTTYNQQTTMSFTNSSTLVLDSTSQFYTYGPAYFGGETFINNTLWMCNSSSSLRTSKLESCAGTGGTIDVQSSLAIAGSFTVEDGLTVTNGPTTLNGDVTIVNGLLSSNGNISTSSYMKACTSGAQVAALGACPGVNPVPVTGNWRHTTGQVNYAGGTAATFESNALVDLLSGGFLRWALAATATASSTAVTANGRFVLINVDPAVCDTSSTNPCTITVTNSAIAVSTTVASAGIVSIGTISASAIYTVALDNILAPSLDVLFYCPTSCGPNVAFSFYVMLWN